MSTPEELVELFNSSRDQYEAFLLRVLDHIRNRFEPRLDERSCYGRVKTTKSFYEKLSRKAYSSLADVPDLAAARIVVDLPSDKAGALEFLKNEFDCFEIEDKLATTKPNEFGYRGIHVLLRPKNNQPGFEPSTFHCEIQIRTKAEDLWNSLSHQFVYKDQHGISDTLERRLNRLSAVCEIFDDEVDFVASQLMQQSEGLPYRMTKLVSKISQQLVNSGLEDKNTLASMRDLLELVPEESRATIDQDVERFAEEMSPQLRTVLRRISNLPNPPLYGLGPEVIFVFFLLGQYPAETIHGWQSVAAMAELEPLASQWGIEVPKL